MRFEWDETKRISNLEDHGVDFKDAALIFEGAFLQAEDTRGDCGERRFRALGRVDQQAFMVAFTWRGVSRRIISPPHHQRAASSAQSRR